MKLVSIIKIFCNSCFDFATRGFLLEIKLLPFCGKSWHSPHSVLSLSSMSGLYTDPLQTKKGTVQLLINRQKTNKPHICNELLWMNTHVQIWKENIQNICCICTINHKLARHAIRNNCVSYLTGFTTVYLILLRVCNTFFFSIPVGSLCTCTAISFQNLFVSAISVSLSSVLYW